MASSANCSAAVPEFTAKSMLAPDVFGEFFFERERHWPGRQPPRAENLFDRSYFVFAYRGDMEGNI